MRRRVPRLVVIALFCLLALTACGPSASTHHPSKAPPFATISAQIPLDGPSEKYYLLVSDTGVWVHDFDSGKLLRIDPNTNKVAATIPTASGAGAIAIGAGYVWVVGHDDSASSVWKVDPTTNQVVDVISLPYPNSGLAVSPGAVWVASVGTQTITRIDPRTDKIAATISIPDGPGWMSYGAGSLWVCGFHQGSILRLNPTTGKTLKRFDLGGNAAHHCAAVTALDNTVWAEVLIGDDGLITGSLMYRIDPTSNTLDPAPSTMPGALGEGIATDGQQAWVYDNADLYRIDPQTGQVVGSLAVLGGNGIALGDGSVWLATTDPSSDTGMLLRYTPAS